MGMPRFANIPSGLPPIVVMSRLAKARDQCKAISHIVRDWAAASETYAKALGKLSSAYPFPKSQGDSKNTFSLDKGYKSLCDNFNRTSTLLLGASAQVKKSHGSFVEFVRSQTAEKREIFVEANKREKLLQKAEDSHASAKKAYRSSLKEAERQLQKRKDYKCMYSLIFTYGGGWGGVMFVVKAQNAGQQNLAQVLWLKNIEQNIKKTLEKSKATHENYLKQYSKLRKVQEENLMAISQCEVKYKRISVQIMGLMERIDKKRIERCKRMLSKISRSLQIFFNSINGEQNLVQEAIMQIDSTKDIQQFVNTLVNERGFLDTTNFRSVTLQPYEGATLKEEGLLLSIPRSMKMEIARPIKEEIDFASDVFLNEDLKMMFRDFLESERSSENINLLDTNNEFIRLCVDFTFTNGPKCLKTLEESMRESSKETAFLDEEEEQPMFKLDLEIDGKTAAAVKTQKDIDDNTTDPEIGNGVSSPRNSNSRRGSGALASKLLKPGIYAILIQVPYNAVKALQSNNLLREIIIHLCNFKLRLREEQIMKRFILPEASEEVISDKEHRFNLGEYIGQFKAKDIKELANGIEIEKWLQGEIDGNPSIVLEGGTAAELGILLLQHQYLEPQCAGVQGHGWNAQGYYRVARGEIVSDNPKRGRFRGREIDLSEIGTRDSTRRRITEDLKENLKESISIRELGMDRFIAESEIKARLLSIMDGATLVNRILITPRLTSINLSNTNLGRDTYVALFVLLRHMTDLKQLHLRRIGCNGDVLVALSALIQSSSSLREVDLGFNDIGVRNDEKEQFSDEGEPLILGATVLGVLKDGRNDEDDTSSNRGIQSDTFHKSEEVKLVLDQSSPSRSHDKSASPSTIADILPSDLQALLNGITKSSNLEKLDLSHNKLRKNFFTELVDGLERKSGQNSESKFQTEAETIFSCVLYDLDLTYNQYDFTGTEIESRLSSILRKNRANFKRKSVIDEKRMNKRHSTGTFALEALGSEFDDWSSEGTGSQRSNHGKYRRKRMTIGMRSTRSPSISPTSRPGSRDEHRNFASRSVPKSSVNIKNRVNSHSEHSQSFRKNFSEANEADPTGSKETKIKAVTTSKMKLEEKPTPKLKPSSEAIEVIEKIKPTSEDSRINVAPSKPYGDLVEGREDSSEKVNVAKELKKEDDKKRIIPKNVEGVEKNIPRKQEENSKIGRGEAKEGEIPQGTKKTELVDNEKQQHKAKEKPAVVAKSRSMTDIEKSKAKKKIPPLAKRDSLVLSRVALYQAQLKKLEVSRSRTPKKKIRLFRRSATIDDAKDNYKFGSKSQDPVDVNGAE
eukprot:jgi/Bigna1/83678/fgenesh1_pg.113_\